MLRPNFFPTLLTAFCLVLTLSGLLNAQQATPSRSDNATVGTISGTVVNESGQPLVAPQSQCEPPDLPLSAELRPRTVKGILT